MAKRTFAPAPWDCRHNGDHFVVKDARGTHIATVEDLTDHEYGDEACEKNALLIKYAPELLARLDFAYNTIQQLAGEVNYTSQRWHSEHIQPIAALLAKFE